MLNQIELIAQVLIEHLGNTVIPSVGAVVLLTLVLTMFKSINASTKYILWLSTLVLISAIPIASEIDFDRMADNKPEADQRTAQQFNFPFGIVEPQRLLEPAQKNDSEIDLRPAEASITTPAVARNNSQGPSETTASASSMQASAKPMVRSLEISSSFAMIALGIWVVIAAALLLRLLLSYSAVRNLKRKGTPMGAIQLERLKNVSTHLAGVRNTSICISDEIRSPIALGLFRPMILIPRVLADSLSDEELEHVVLHEMAHIRRFDDWIKLIQKVTQALFFFNPAVWWIGKNLDLEREIACDDFVISVQAHGRRAYASSLIKVAKHALNRTRLIPYPVPRMAETKIEKRVRMILNSKRSVSTQIYNSAFVLIIVAITLGVGAFMVVSPEIKISARPEMKTGMLESDAEGSTSLSEGTYLYWFNVLSSEGPDAIQRLNLNGDGIQNAVLINRHNPASFLPLQKVYKYGKPGKVVVAGDRIYWSDLEEGAIKVANLDGSEIQVLMESQGQIAALDVDVVGLKVYWAENVSSPTGTTGFVRRMNLNGTAAETLQTRAGPITDFEIDHAHARLFWAENSEVPLNERFISSAARGSIYRADLPRGEPKRIKSAFSLVTAIALDEQQEFVYWAQVPSEEVVALTGERSAILRISMDGFNDQEIVHFELSPSSEEVEQSVMSGGVIPWSGKIGPFDLVLDDEQQMLYWSLMGTELPRKAGKIQRARTNGEQIEDVVVGLANPIGIALIEHAEAESNSIEVENREIARTGSGGAKVYWLESTPSQLMKRSNPDGTSVEEIFAPSLAFELGMQIPASTQQPCLTDSYQLGLDVNRANVLYSTASSYLGSLDLKANEINSHYYQNIGFPMEGFRYNPDEKAIYGIGYENGGNDSTIVKAHLASSASQAIVREPNAMIDHFALDTRADKVYWSVLPFAAYESDILGAALIKRADLDGSNVEELLWLDTRALNFEIDLYESTLYIRTTSDVESSTIRKFDVSNSAVTRLPSIDLGILGDSFSPCVYKIDSINKQLYMLDTSQGVIATTDLEGRDFQPILTGLESPFALALDIWTQRVSMDEVSAKSVGGGGGP